MPPNPLSLRNEPDAVAPTFQDSLSNLQAQRQALEERQKKELLLQEQAREASLTSSPSPMIQGISSALIAALPYLAGRAGGGTTGGAIGAQQGQLAAQNYQTTLQNEQKRKAEIADLYLNRSSKLDAQISGLAEKESSLLQRQEAQTAQRDLQQTIAEGNQALRADSNANTRAMIGIQSALAQSTIAQRDKELALKEREVALKENNPKASEQEKEAHKDDLLRATLDPGQNMFVPGGETKDYVKAFKDKKGAEDAITKSAQTSDLLQNIQALRSDIAANGTFTESAQQKLSYIKAQLKGKDIFNFGAALTQGELTVLNNIVGLADRTDLRGKAVREIFGDNPQEGLNGLQKIMTLKYLDYATSRRAVPNFQGTNLLAPWANASPKEQEAVKKLVEQKTTYQAKRMVEGGQATDINDARTKINLMLTGQYEQ